MIEPKDTLELRKNLRNKDRLLCNYLAIHPLAKMTPLEKVKFRYLLVAKERAKRDLDNLVEELTIITKVEPIFFDGMQWFVWTRIETFRRDTITKKFKNQDEAMHYHASQVKKMQAQKTQ